MCVCWLLAGYLRSHFTELKFYYKEFNQNPRAKDFLAHHRISVRLSDGMSFLIKCVPVSSEKLPHAFSLNGHLGTEAITRNTSHKRTLHYSEKLQVGVLGRTHGRTLPFLLRSSTAETIHKEVFRVSLHVPVSSKCMHAFKARASKSSNPRFYSKVNRLQQAWGESSAPLGNVLATQQLHFDLSAP